jgi:cyclic pyranopterin phosphate synthase
VTLPDGAALTIGFITPMSCNFCANCNRMRITAEGVIYPCLMDRPGPSLLSALRPVYDPDRLDAILAASLATKAAEHPHDGHAVMTHIGG